MSHLSTILRPASAFLILMVAGCFSQPKDNAAGTSALTGAAASPSTSANWTATQKVTVTDNAVRMTAFTVSIPSGWKYAGMILRPGGCHAPSVPAYGLSFSTVGPDNVTAYSVLPGVTWDWESDGKSPQGPRCQPVSITTAAAFLLNIAIPNLRPDAKNISIVPLPAQMQSALQAQQRAVQAQAGGGHNILDAARVRLEYQLNGQAVEELIGAVVACQEMNMPAYPLLNRPAITRRFCHSNGTSIRRAPKGGLDALIAKDLPAPQIDPAWDARIQQQMRANFASWQKANDAQFAAIQQHYKEVTAGMIQRGKEAQAQLQNQTDNAMAQDRATQGAIDHAAQQQVLDSLNRQVFLDPNTGQKIETSNQFTHNWINSSGTTVALGNDPTADPNGSIDPVRESWTELIPIN
ncbi:MAG TPA: hypothetical protein VGI45_21435 [Terracidiphilus sp.]|jgi:hypothetical protein